MGSKLPFAPSTAASASGAWGEAMTGEPKWTPGPWHFVDSNLRRVTAATHSAVMNPVSICGIHRIGRWVGKENLDEQAANGHLIAAAPELYEALVRCRRRLADNGIPEPPEVAPALAKALGETP